MKISAKQLPEGSRNKRAEATPQLLVVRIEYGLKGFGPCSIERTDEFNELGRSNSSPASEVMPDSFCDVRVCAHSRVMIRNVIADSFEMAIGTHHGKLVLPRHSVQQ